MEDLPGLAARRRARRDRPAAAGRQLRPLGHRRPVHRPARGHRRADDLRLRRPSRRRRLRRARLRHGAAWLAATRDAVKSCGCERGCPSCVQSPKCGNGNNPLDKQGAVAVLSIDSQPSALTGPARAVADRPRSRCGDGDFEPFEVAGGHPRVVGRDDASCPLAGLLRAQGRAGSSSERAQVGCSTSLGRRRRPPSRARQCPGPPRRASGRLLPRISKPHRDPSCHTRLHGRRGAAAGYPPIDGHHHPASSRRTAAPSTADGSSPRAADSAMSRAAETQPSLVVAAVMASTPTMSKQHQRGQ